MVTQSQLTDKMLVAIAIAFSVIGDARSYDQETSAFLAIALPVRDHAYYDSRNIDVLRNIISTRQINANSAFYKAFDIPAPIPAMEELLLLAEMHLQVAALSERNNDTGDQPHGAVARALLSGMASATPDREMARLLVDYSNASCEGQSIHCEEYALRRDNLFNHLAISILDQAEASRSDVTRKGLLLTGWALLDAENRAKRAQWIADELTRIGFSLEAKRVLDLAAARQERRS